MSDPQPGTPGRTQCWRDGFRLPVGPRHLRPYRTGVVALQPVSARHRPLPAWCFRGVRPGPGNWRRRRAHGGGAGRAAPLGRSMGGGGEVGEAAKVPDQDVVDVVGGVEFAGSRSSRGAALRGRGRPARPGRGWPPGEDVPDADDKSSLVPPVQVRRDEPAERCHALTSDPGASGLTSGSPGAHMQEDTDES
jgi:hypothetical protein